MHHYPVLYSNKNTSNVPLNAAPLHRSSPLCCGLSRRIQSHTVSGSLFAAPPCSPAHLPRPVHHGLCDAGRDINNKS